MIIFRTAVSAEIDGRGISFHSIQNYFCLKALQNLSKMTKKTRRIYLLIKIMVNHNDKNENEPHKKKRLRSLDRAGSHGQESKAVSYINSLRKKKHYFNPCPRSLVFTQRHFCDFQLTFVQFHKLLRTAYSLTTCIKGEK